MWAPLSGIDSADDTSATHGESMSEASCDTMPPARQNMKAYLKVGPLAAIACCAALAATTRAADVAISIDARMDPPKWAVLERQLLAENVPAAQEFFKKYLDDRGFLQCYVRWGANDGPDDAFENFNRWPELHALGAGDEIQRMYSRGHDGLIRQYTEARTTDVPSARQGMYYKEFIVQSDWMHHGEGLQLFNRMGLSVPTDAKYLDRARRFAGFYMNEDPEAPNYDPKLKIIRSMQNGSRGPMLRKATSLDWVGDPFDVTRFDAEHGESTFDQFLAHYQEYTDVVGDHFLNLASTSLQTNAFLLTGDVKYKTWVVEYMDAWLERMKQNGGIIPSFVDLDGTIGGPEGKWWGNAYGWGFSPVNPVTGRRENRNRIPRALVGFNNALWVTGDQKYVDAWRNMIDAVNSHARMVDGRIQYPTMYGSDGWYGWQAQPWNVGALEFWYWSMKPRDLQRTGIDPWIAYLQGQNPSYPETELHRDLQTIQNRLAQVRRDTSTASERLADNMMDFNPVAVDGLIRLTLGGMPPGRDGGLLNARLRYFDPARKRAGLPEDVGALVSEMTDALTTVTLVNLNKATQRQIVVQGGAYAEHRIESVEWNGRTVSVNSPSFTVKIAPGAGATLTLQMKRYSEKPTKSFPESM